MTYQQAISYLSGLNESHIKPGLERIESVLTALGAPHRRFPHLLVGGTNGKGSVVRFIGAALQACGIRAGLFTSPHLHRFEERITVDGCPEEPGAIADLVETVKGAGGELSYFEFATAMALEAFRRHRVEVAVLEVGLGGRWDATNVTDPLVSVITTIGIDHTSWLGNTPEEIAAEKACIARRGRDVVVGRVGEPALSILLSSIAAIGARPVLLGRDFRITGGRDRGSWNYQGIRWRFKGLVPGLAGHFQADNAACALAALESLAPHGFSLPARGLQSGIAATRWPARYEKLATALPTIVDAAHNQPAMRALVDQLARDGVEPVWLFGCLADKDIRSMVQTAMERPGPMVVVPVPHPKALAVEDARSTAAEVGVEVETAGSVFDGLRRARELAAGDRTVVVAGSVFLAAAVLEAVADGAEGTRP